MKIYGFYWKIIIILIANRGIFTLPLQKEAIDEPDGIFPSGSSSNNWTGGPGEVPYPKPGPLFQQTTSGVLL